MPKLRLLSFGEAMAEMQFDTDNNVKLGFAGDVYNSLIYAKRMFSDIDTSLVSAVGNDRFSKLLVQHAENHQVNGELLKRSSSENLGIYAINLDENGERSFDYWRKGSAASQMFSDVTALDKWIEAINEAEHTICFFSGITLAILSDEHKDLCLAFMQKIKAKNVRIAFDPNYRPTLWNNAEHARAYFEKAFAIADILLPGVEDQEDVFGQTTAEECIAYFSALDNKEVILKAGKQGMFGITDSAVAFNVPFNPAPKQVDSTSAGDSFAGAFLAARLKGFEVQEAVELANEVAREVVQHKGAIVPEDAFNNFKNTLGLLK